MKRRIHIFSICLVLALFLGHAAAADSPFSVDVWNTADGLPQSSVIAITQTHDGYLWLGTLNGLVRFDGNAFTKFNVNNTPGLPSDVIVFLFEDSQNILWVGTETAGLCAIQKGIVKNFETGGGGKIMGALEDEEKSVWFAADDGRIFNWQNGRLDVHPKTPPQLAARLLGRSLHQIVSCNNAVTWRLGLGHIEKWRGEKLEQDFGAAPWTVNPVVAAFFNSPGGISFDANIKAACEDAEGNLVVATQGEGIFWMNATGLWRQISKNQGLSGNLVLSLFVDRGGNLWAGTDPGGLNRLTKKLFSSPPELHPWVAQSSSADMMGGMWFAFNSRGLSYLKTNAVSDFGIGIGSNAWTVLADQRGKTWAGTRGEGLFEFMSYYFRPVTGAPVGRQIFALFEARDGKIWAGGENGLGSFDGTNWMFYATSNSVRAIAEDSPTNLWIGTEGGLFQLHAGKLVPANAPVSDISCLLTARDGSLWAGTSGHGLARFANGSWQRCTSRDGLAGDDIGYLIEDDAGNLWFGAYEGLSRIEKKSLSDFFDNAGAKISCRTFLTRECSAGAQPAAIRTADGRFWFPTIEGMVSLNPADLKADTNPPPVVIESVLVDGREQKTNALSSRWNGALTLTPANEQLEIHFTALNFSALRRAQTGAHFRYRFEPRDKNWIEVGGERVLRFRAADLPPGKFIFRVSACNEEGVWNETGAILDIHVLPPFWKTWWFLTLAILVFIAALAGIIYLISTQKLKRQLRAARQKELIERERARIARDLHDQLGANLTQVTLLGEMAEMDKDSPGEVELHAQQICATARDTTRSLDEIVWAVNPSNDTLEGLANYACKYAQDYFALAGMSFRADLPHDLPAQPIPPEVRHNVFLAFKEAVNNVVKHAHASEARVKLQLEADQFILSVEDNGRGTGDVSGKTLRNGLKNMRKRLADVRGEFEIGPAANGGTLVQLKVPFLKSSA